VAARTVADPVHVNEVHLVGRVAAAPQRRELPSGDVLVQFRLVVGRAPRRRPAGGRAAPTVDTLDCAVWRADVARSVTRLGPGDVVEVHGSLRRRFWRSAAGGAASRSEVEVTRVRRVAAAT
jgi:single-strand DNA-binding protein